MILVDTNLLLYAYNSSSEHHKAARDWVEHVFSGTDPVRIAWSTVLSFIRIGTNPRVFPHPLTTKQAVHLVSEWLNLPNVTILEPGLRHWEILGELLSTTQANGTLVQDADLAALAIEHGLLLCSTDQDFTRFPKLRHSNPLIKSTQTA